MTRSVTIVNTSNWEHEDVAVMAAHHGGVALHTLKPGDTMLVGPHADGQLVSVTMQGVTPAEPVPFRDADGEQDWPKVEVHKPSKSE